MKTVLVSLLLTALAGCQVMPQTETRTQQHAQLREIIVQNDNPHAITDFSIRVPATGAVYGCSFIAPGGQCASRFPARAVANNPPLIRWREHDLLYQHSPTGAPLPVTARALQITFHLRAGILNIRFAENPE